MAKLQANGLNFAWMSLIRLAQGSFVPRGFTRLVTFDRIFSLYGIG